MIRVGTGGCEIEIPEGLQEHFQKALDAAAGEIVQMIELELTTIGTKVLQGWPVGPDRDNRNVHSRDTIRWGLRIDPNFESFTGYMTWDQSAAPWVPYIKTKKLGGGDRGSPLQVLIRLPMLKARDRIYSKLDNFDAFLAGIL